MIVGLGFGSNVSLKVWEQGLGISGMFRGEGPCKVFEEGVSI